MSYTDHNGSGVGAGVQGWLMFLVLVMAVFSPLTVIITTAGALYGTNGLAHAFPERWTMIQVFEWSLAAIMIAGCWYIAWRLYRVFIWQTVRIAIAGIWLLLGGSLLVESLGISLITGLPVADIAAAALDATLVRQILSCSLWTAYLLRSKRVANTYLRHDSSEVAEVFG